MWTIFRRKNSRHLRVGEVFINVQVASLRKSHPYTCTDRLEINWNDFRRFFALFSRLEFEFCRCGKHVQITIRVFLFSELIHTQCGITFTCVVACFHMRVDEMQTHSGQKKREITTTHIQTNIGRHIQTDTDKQDDDLYVYIHIYMYVSVYVYIP